ncbi:hypothetical protein BESB_054470 [Besnoitia besnoiti]|uniref:RecQ-mediated genome instability protein 1 n=1 Tax=Besnoitia besnoiti TaxID=94643 RepID=A0A2A9MIK6_BESBE|nr:hypothetical protein BESB_054470 [Besnoitia besnoiti]PFH35796.1 hypothetical protein BESB_054470 [Besnoitia besnoiti]
MSASALDAHAQRICEGLQAKGLLATPEWTRRECRRLLSSPQSSPHFSSASSTSRGTLAFPDLTEEKLGDAFLRSEFAESAQPSLPAGVCALERGALEGVHLLEVLEAANLNESRKARTRLAPSKNRFLKVVLSDGHTSVAAVEYRPIPAFSEATLQPGAKLLVCGAPPVRRGLVFLQQAHVRVVWGGAAPAEEAAGAGEAKEEAPSANRAGGRVDAKRETVVAELDPTRPLAERPYAASCASSAAAAEDPTPAIRSEKIRQATPLSSSRDGRQLSLRSEVRGCFVPEAASFGRPPSERLRGGAPNGVASEVHVSRPQTALSGVSASRVHTSRRHGGDAMATRCAPTAADGAGHGVPGGPHAGPGPRASSALPVHLMERNRTAAALPMEDADIEELADLALEDLEDLAVSGETFAGAFDSVCVVASPNRDAASSEASSREKACSGATSAASHNPALRLACAASNPARAATGPAGGRRVSVHSVSSESAEEAEAGAREARAPRQARASPLREAPAEDFEDAKGRRLPVDSNSSSSSSEACVAARSPPSLSPSPAPPRGLPVKSRATREEPPSESETPSMKASALSCGRNASGSREWWVFAAVTDAKWMTGVREIQGRKRVYSERGQFESAATGPAPGRPAAGKCTYTAGGLWRLALSDGSLSGYVAFVRNDLLPVLLPALCAGGADGVVDAAHSAHSSPLASVSREVVKLALLSLQGHFRLTGAAETSLWPGETLKKEPRVASASARPPATSPEPEGAPAGATRAGGEFAWLVVSGFETHLSVSDLDRELSELLDAFDAQCIDLKSSAQTGGSAQTANNHEAKGRESPQARSSKGTH